MAIKDITITFADYTLVDGRGSSADQGQIPGLLARLSLADNEVPSNPDVYGFNFGTNPGATLAVGEDSEGKFLHAAYDADLEGDNYIYGGCDLGLDGVRQLYIQCYARMADVKHGLKFIKLFGLKPESTNYANATFAFDYTGIEFGCMYAVSFGDGTTEENDTQNVLFFDGTNPEYIGRSFGTAVLSTPQNAIWSADNWGTTKHKFQIMFRHNTGTTAEDELPNGAFEVRIDDVLYAKAENIFTRHPTNGYFQSVGLFGATQNNPEAFTFDIFEGLTISTDGWVD